jgi:hypothetical protein
VCTRAIDRHACRIAHAWAAALGSHQAAWLERDEQESEELLRALRGLAQLPPGREEPQVQDAARDAEAVWQQTFGTPEHTRWSVIWSAFQGLRDGDGLGRLAVLVCVNTCAAAMGPGNLPANMDVELEGVLQEELRATQPLLW